MNDSFDEHILNTPTNQEYLRHRGENILNITLAQSQMIFAIPEEEGESGGSETQAGYLKRLF